MAPEIMEKSWKDMRPTKVRWRVKNMLRQGDSNLYKRSPYCFSSSFNSSMPELHYILHYLHFI